MCPASCGNLRLSGKPARSFTRVLARIGRCEIRATAQPAAAELVPDARSVDQILRTIHATAAAG